MGYQGKLLDWLDLVLPSLSQDSVLPFSSQD